MRGALGPGLCQPHPGCSITACTPFPKPQAQRGTARLPLPRGPSPWILRGAKSLRAAPCSPRSVCWSPASSLRTLAPPLPPALPGSFARQLPTQRPGCPGAAVWSQDIRAGTEARSLSEQRPQNSSASCQAWDVFPCNVSRGRLPMTRLLDIPSPGRAGGTAGAPGFAELITPSLITARRRVTCLD